MTFPISENAANSGLETLQQKPPKKVDYNEIRIFSDAIALSNDPGKGKDMVLATKIENGKNVTFVGFTTKFNVDAANSTPQKGYELVGQYLQNTLSAASGEPIKVDIKQVGPGFGLFITSNAPLNENATNKLVDALSDPKLAEKVIQNVKSLYGQKFNEMLNEEPEVKPSAPKATPKPQKGHDEHHNNPQQKKVGNQI